MPAKIDADANLRFLYICFKHSNFSTIDYHKVAAHFQIKAPAARMRLMRLRMALEGESSKDPRLKRNKDEKAGKGKAYVFYDDEDDDEALDNLPLADRMKLRMLMKREEGVKREDGWEAGVKREFGWEGVKKEEEDDDKGRVKMEAFDGTAFKTEEGVEGHPSHGGVKIEQDIKTESDTGRLAYPAPFTFAPTTPTFSNPFLQVKTEPGVAFPGYKGQNYPHPDTTVTESSNPRLTESVAIPTYQTPKRDNTTYRTDSPMLGNVNPNNFMSTGHSPSPTLHFTPDPNTPSQTPLRHFSPPFIHDTPMLEADDVVKRDESSPSSVPQPSIPEHIPAASDASSFKSDNMELTDQDIMKDTEIVTPSHTRVEGDVTDADEGGGAGDGAGTGPVGDLASPLYGVKLQGYL